MSSKPMPENVLYACLPGETVKGVMTGCKNRIVKRKHRDIVIQINIKNGKTYTLRASRSNFYSEREKALIEYKQNGNMTFQDGERVYACISRDFVGKLIIEHAGKVLGEWEPNKLDAEKYGKDPSIRPEPLMIIINGKPLSPKTLICMPSDPYGHQAIDKHGDDMLIDYLSDEKLKKSKHDYILEQLKRPEIQEHYIAGNLSSREIRPEVIKELNQAGRVSGSPMELILEPQKGSQLDTMINNIVAGVDDAMTNSVSTSNYFKESAGYIQSNWKRFNILGMKMYIEKAPVGQYRFVLKGKLITPKGLSAKSKTIKMPVGRADAEFMGANYTKTGRHGYGGFKRIFLTTKGNFRAGMGLQAIGTVIDLYGDFKDTFGDGKSKDVSEFFARAGVSILKAGATAALGGILTLVVGAAITFFTAASAVPVLLGVAVVVTGYIIAANMVDFVDSSLSIKERAASAAR